MRNLPGRGGGLTLSRYSSKGLGGRNMAVMNYKGLKKGSVIDPVNDRKFSLRLRVTGGKVTGKQLQKVYDIANIYGKGYIHMASHHSI